VNGVGKGLEHAAAHQAQGSHRDRNRLRTNEVPDQAIQPQSGDGPKVKGVVRLLQEGHFKGVADVRLRINHFEELSGLEHESLAQAAEEGLPALLDAVNSQVQFLLDSGELTGEQASGVSEAQALFNTQVEEAVGAFVNGHGIQASALVQDVQSAFDALADALSPLLTALEGAVAEAVTAPVETKAGTESVVATAVRVETVGALEASAATSAAVESEPVPTAEAPPESVLEGYLGDLRASFDTALGQFGSGVAEASTLPPVSEPSGNGKAYAKFAAMYQELYGVTEPPADLEKTGPAPIDTSA
jgi:hypothetical protein